MGNIEQGMNKAITLDPTALTEQAKELGIVGRDTSEALNRSSVLFDGDEPTAGAELDDLGISATMIKTNEAYLFLVVLDDSGSIHNAGAEQDVLDGYNALLADYQRARDAGEIHSDVLFAVASLNRGIIQPYMRVEDARPLSADDYYANGGTPLFDVTIRAHKLQIAKTTELALNGVTARTLTLLVTDGNDEGSRSQASDVADIVKDLVTDKHHIVAGIYRGDANEQTFADMGIPPQWIGDGKNLLNAFSRFSRASQSALRDTAGKPNASILS